jgi:hypothetical protein
MGVWGLGVAAQWLGAWSLGFASSLTANPDGVGYGRVPPANNPTFLGGSVQVPERLRSVVLIDPIVWLHGAALAGFMPAVPDGDVP